MTPTLSIEAAGKLLVSIFNELYPPCYQHDYDENTLGKVKDHFNMTGFTIELPLVIKLADDYAAVFTQIMNDVSSDDLSNFAKDRAMHAANFGLNGATEHKNKFHDVKLMNCEEKIKTTKDVLDDLQSTGVIKIQQQFSPVIR